MHPLAYRRKDARSLLFESYDSQMLETLRDQFPDADPVHLAALGDIWSVEVSKIVDRMLGVAKDRGVSGLPVLARPEASFQLANLVLMLQGQVIKRKTARTSIQTIDAEAERDALTSPLIQDRIENTAIILAEHVWLPLCERWWKRFPMIPQESAKSAKRIPRRPAHGGSRRQHFSPQFSNKYWTSADKLRVYALGVDGIVRSSNVRARSWGYESFLYSQGLEHLLCLVEGDAGGPYKKLLQMVPLNEDETKQWVAYLAAQCIRTPAFILRLLPRVRRFVTEQGLDFPTDAGSLRRAYETLFSNDTVFAEMHQRLVGRRWEMWNAVAKPGFVRPDEPVLVTSEAGGGWRLIYPMTPTYCFVAGPVGSETPRPVVPHIRVIDERRLSQLNLQLAVSSRRTVIARPQTDDSDLRALLASGMRRRSFQACGSSSHEFWGRIGG